MSGEPPLPPAIGRYRPTGVLGSGAMGTVYRAHDPAIDRVVAIKVIRTDALEQDMRDEYIARFRREVQAAGRCSHAAIVGVFDYSGDAHNPYIVMEMVEGAPLQTIIRDPARRAAVAASGGPGPLILSVIRQVLDGLGYAHRLGITHRDVKPANILVTPDGRAKIVDFGIARLAEGAMTQDGSMLGTPSYMSPEQVSDTEVDYRADLFAVGAILYESIVGRAPFVGRNLSDTILRLSLPDPAPMQPLADAGGGAFVPVLQRALAKRRDQRFQSAEEFAAALAAVGAAPMRAAAVARAPADDGTMIMTGAGARSHPPVLPTGAADPGSLDGSLTQARWDPALLRRIERALAAQVGPMARLMLRDKAHSALTADDLVQALAAGLGSPADRDRFLRAVAADAAAAPPGVHGGRAGPAESTLNRSGGLGATLGRTGGAFSAGAAPAASNPPALGQTGLGRTGTGGGGPFSGITAPAVEAAQAALVGYVGPMARVLARKAAAEAASPQDFIERLCAHVAKPDENAALRRRLRAEVEPKMM
jgi:serine/threonine-protein kinase